LWCPCCGRLLRTKPRGTRLKRRLLLRKRDKEEDGSTHLSKYTESNYD
jgi:hypothetical protein